METARLEELRDFVRTVDPDLQRSFDFVVDEIRDTGDAKSAYNVRGHAAVFDKWSLDLGGFREKVNKAAFDGVLSRDPHVLHLWDHDSRYVLSSTRNKTLELRVDPMGLHYWSRVAKTSYADDLRVLLERGDISQSSFAFTVAKDEWRISEEDGEEIIEREILEVKDLYDVTTTAMGAYASTDAALAVRACLAAPRKTTSMPISVDGKKVAEALFDGFRNNVASFRVLDKASEPENGSEETPDRLSEEAGVPERRADESAGTADRGEVLRLRREAQAAADIARERLYRRVS